MLFQQNGLFKKNGLFGQEFARPTMSFDFLGSTSLTSPQGIALTFSRGSGAMQFYSDGYMDWAAENTITNSELYSDASWTKSGTSSIAPYVGPGFGGITDVWEYKQGASVVASDFLQKSFGAVVGQIYTQQWRIKAGGVNPSPNVIIAFGGASSWTGSSIITLQCNLTTGVSGITSGTAHSFSSSLESDGSVIITLSALCVSAGTPAIRAYSFTVNGTFLIASAQLQRGTHLTNYFKTTSAAVYGPAFDYNTAKSYNNNENLVLWSEDQTNADYAKTGATLTVSPTTPNGVGAAFKINEDTSNGTHRCAGTNTNVIAGLNYTAQVRVKADERTVAFVQIANSSFWQGGNPGLYVNLIDGSVAGFAGKGYTVTPDVDGWWVVTWTGLCIQSGTTAGLLVHAAISMVSANYVGVSGWGIHIAGFGLNKGVTASVYTKTTTTQVLGNQVAPARGLAIWEARTNLVPWSEDFTQASYIKTDTTVTANTTETLSPEGLFNATKLTCGSAANDEVSVAVTITAGNRVISSNAIKRGNHDWVRILLFDGTFTNRIEIYYNIATGIKGSSTLFGLATLSDFNVIDIGNGWYVPWIDGTLDPASTSATLSVRTATANNNNARVSGGFRYQFYTQVESITVAAANASTGRVTSYIPTFGASATRSTDIVGIDTTNQAVWYNGREGTFDAVFEPSYINSNAASRGAALSFEIDSNTHHRILSSVAAIAKADTVVAGTTISSYSTPTLVQGAVNNMVYGYQVNFFQAYFNGSNLGSTTIAPLTLIRIGNRNNDYLNGWVPYVSYYNILLPSATMGSLSVQ